MRLGRITLQHFRNITAADLRLAGRRTFLAGRNAQGKSNLLEAAGFISALRSFRTADARLLIEQGQAEAGVACELEHEKLGAVRLVITLRPGGRSLWCDGVPVARLADHLGRFPTVVFSAGDLQLVRGAPAARRRWLDLALAAVDSDYVHALQTYHRALAERNRLLQKGAAGARAEEELEAFERLLAPAAARLVAGRRLALTELGRRLAAVYGQLVAEAEPAELRLRPDSDVGAEEAWRGLWREQRARDLRFRTTLHGPHRDDVELLVSGQAARDYASEGQQRSLVLALRLGQSAWLRERCEVRPVLLADDVLGELDPERRERFWTAVDPEAQIIATGTMPPPSGQDAWQVFSVAGGVFTENHGESRA